MPLHPGRTGSRCNDRQAAPRWMTPVPPLAAAKAPAKRIRPRRRPYRHSAAPVGPKTSAAELAGRGLPRDPVRPSGGRVASGMRQDSEPSAVPDRATRCDDYGLATAQHSRKSVRDLGKGDLPVSARTDHAGDFSRLFSQDCRYATSPSRSRIEPPVPDSDAEPPAREVVVAGFGAGSVTAWTRHIDLHQWADGTLVRLGAYRSDVHREPRPADWESRRRRP
jgi:hypothetical protein